MNTRRVLVVSSNLLFLDAIRRIIKHPGIEIVGTFPNQNTDLIEQLEALKPDIVIWEGEPQEIETKAIQILEKTHQKIRIINLNSVNNAVNIYAADLGTLNSPDELLQMILKE